MTTPPAPRGRFLDREASRGAARGWAILLAAALGAGCALPFPALRGPSPGPLVAGDLGDRRSYGFAPVTETIVSESLDWTSVIALKAALGNGLAARGFRRAEGGPQLLAVLYAAGGNKVETGAWGRSYGWEGTTWEEYLSGLREATRGLGRESFVLDIIDAADRSLLYRAVAPVGGGGPEQRQARVDETVAALLTGLGEGK